MRTLVLSIAALTLLAACQTEDPNKVKVETDHYKFEYNDGHHHSGHGDFCPPGQAKKGNC